MSTATRAPAEASVWRRTGWFLKRALLMELGVEPPSADVQDAQLVDQLSQHLPIEPVDRQRLLERDDALARASRVLEVLAQLVNAPERRGK